LKKLFAERKREEMLCCSVDVRSLRPASVLPTTFRIHWQTLNPVSGATITARPRPRPWHQSGRKCSYVAASAHATLPPVSLFVLACKATFKLGLLCMGIAHLMRRGILPEMLPQALSKLAFNVTIPCMLVAKTAETLAYSQGDWRCLMVPVAIAIQACSRPQIITYPHFGT
jgi:hypothetical protein